MQNCSSFTHLFILKLEWKRGEVKNHTQEIMRGVEDRAYHVSA